MVRFLTAVAAAAAFVTPAVAQTTQGDPMTMTCADYTALQDSDRAGLLDSLTGDTRTSATGDTASGDVTADAATAGGAGMDDATEESLSASADVSSEDIMMACEGNDDMSLTEAVQQVRSQ